MEWLTIKIKCTNTHISSKRQQMIQNNYRDPTQLWKIQKNNTQNHSTKMQIKQK